MTKTLTTTFCLGFMLTLGACDEGASPKDARTEAAAPQAPAEAKVEAGAHDGGAAPATPPLDPKVELAIEVANKISADPSSADAILADAGLDRESFETLLYEIAKDPELSKSYAIARED